MKDMKRLILDIPADLHRAIKADCALRGRKMAEEVRELLEKRYPPLPAKELVSLNLKVPKDIKQELQRMADDRETTISAVLVEAVRLALHQQRGGRDVRVSEARVRPN